jgi:pimeloyl-ACP methyl ester carboxylesterase
VGQDGALRRPAGGRERSLVEEDSHSQSGSILDSRTYGCMYLVAEKDRAVPVKVQERMVAAVPGMQSLRVPCGHSPFLSHPVETVEVIVKGAELQGGLKASI